jgi:cold shock CspA family protein
MSSNGRHKGVVKFWQQPRGFGFVTVDGGDREIFMHISQWVHDDEPYKGQRVSFVIDKGRDGRECARQATPE